MTTETLVQNHEFGEEWLKRSNTSYISRKVTLGSPITKLMFKRSYMQVNRDIFFLSVFAEYLVKDKEQIRKVQEILRNSLAKASKQLETKVSQLQAVVQNAGVDTDVKFTQTLQANAPVMTPVSSGVLDLFVAGDTMHNLLSACWFAGEIPDEDKRKGEEELKKIIRVFLTTVRTMMGTTIAAMKKQQKEGKLTPEAEANLSEASTHVAETPLDDDLDANMVDADAVLQAETIIGTNADAEESVAKVVEEEVAA